MSTKNQLAENITFEEFRSEILKDYEIARDWVEFGLQNFKSHVALLIIIVPSPKVQPAFK